MSVIVQNKKAFHEYYIENQIEAGIMLLGWEVKAIRAGKANIAEAYVIIKDGEVFLVGAHISSLVTTWMHMRLNDIDPTRTRKLLLNRREINVLYGKVQRAGYTVMPIDLHYSVRGKIKLCIGLAKGKKQHDKRAVEKEKDGKREAAQAMKSRGYNNE